MTTSFVSGLRLDFDILDVTSVIGGELSDNMEELFLSEQVPVMLKKLKKNSKFQIRSMALMRHHMYAYDL